MKGRITRDIVVIPLDLQSINGVDQSKSSILNSLLGNLVNGNCKYFIRLEKKILKSRDQIPF